MERPSMDQWMKEARAEESASKCGMYLFHNGVVRSTPKAKVRPAAPSQAGEAPSGQPERSVSRMAFSYDAQKVEAAGTKALSMPGIYYIRIWLNEGILGIGEDIMLVLVGGDIRPHVIDALQALVGEIKNHCVTETEIYEEMPE